MLALVKNETSEFTINYDCSYIAGTHGIVTLKIQGDDLESGFTLEYVKQCKEIPGSFLLRMSSSICLLIMATVVVGLGVRQDQFTFIRESPEGEMYEIESISILQAFGILALASTVLVGFYILIKYFSLIWVITIVFLFSISTLMIPFFMDLIEKFAKGNVRSI